MRSIDEIRAGAEAATPGPWFFENPDDDMCMNAYTVTVQANNDDLECNHLNVAITLLQSPRYADMKNAWENAKFIANARQDIPDLLAALAEKDEEIERLQTTIELWRTADGKAVTAARAESARLYSVLEDAWYQFAYVDGNGKRWCGGLSTLEDMADVLEIDV